MRPAPLVASFARRVVRGQRNGHLSRRRVETLALTSDRLRVYRARTAGLPTMGLIGQRRGRRVASPTVHFRVTQADSVMPPSPLAQAAGLDELVRVRRDWARGR